MSLLDQWLPGTRIDLRAILREPVLPFADAPDFEGSLRELVAFNGYAFVPLACPSEPGVFADAGPLRIPGGPGIVAFPGAGETAHFLAAVRPERTDVLLIVALRRGHSAHVLDHVARDAMLVQGRRIVDSFRSAD